MNWLVELQTKRLAQNTNVYIVETFDMQRLEQLRNITKEEKGQSKLTELLKIKYDNAVEWNLQRDELTSLKNGEKIASDTMVDRQHQLDDMLIDTKTFAMIYYVFIQAHADRLSDSLEAWAQDKGMHSNSSTVVVFTSDAGLFSDTLRRLCYHITIEPSTADERRTILENTAKTLAEDFEGKFNRKLKLRVTEDLVQASSGLDLHSTETAALESFFLNPLRQFDVSAFTNHKIRIVKEYGMEFILPTFGYRLVGGEGMLKAYTIDNVIVPLRDPELAERYGVGIPKGMIIAGIPGTGKDHFTEATAYELGLAMVKLTPADFFRGVVGESESRVKKVFNLIESLGRVVVYIPEIDQMFLKRGTVAMTDSGVQRRITDMMLDRTGKRDRQYFLMGSTNFIDQMDNASIRPGRFDEVVLQLPPSTPARKEILTIHTSGLRKMPLGTNVDFDDLAEKTFCWTPAELEKLCLTAGRIAMKEKAAKILAKHFNAALGTIEINMPERQQRMHEMVTAMNKLDVVSKQFIDESFKAFKKEEKDQTRASNLIKAL